MRTIEESNAIATEHEGLIYFFANMWRHSGLDLHDRISICGIALVKASRTWDGSSSMSYWLGRYVHSQMLAFIRKIRFDQKSANRTHSCDLKAKPIHEECDIWPSLKKKSHLTDRELYSIQCRIDGMDLKEISARMNVSHQRVHQLQVAAMLKIAGAAVDMDIDIPKEWRDKVNDYRGEVQNFPISCNAA